MSTTTPPIRTRTMSSMSAMRRPTSTSSSTTTSSSARSRHSMGGPGSEQTTPRSSLASRESLVSPPLSASSAQGTARASPLARGATARAAVPPPPSRGGSANGIKRGSPVPDRSESPAMSEALEGALRREVEEKEELMMRLASRDESIAELQGQIKEMRATMEQGGGRLAELYADQERWEAERASLEEDIAKKNNVIDKLRTQLRELEKENRDNTRRLTEQAAQFESERQAFYDNTAHLKSRIQSLTDAQKDWKQSQREPSPEPNAEQDQEQDQAQDPEQQQERKAKPRTSLARSEPEEPPEMTALRLELSTLGTSHGSLGQTVKMLQSQLAEIERVNAELQEENEAFTTLLREKTLSGQIDIMRHGPDDHSEDEMEQASVSGTLESELAGSERQASMSPVVETRRVVSHTYSLRRAVSPARSGRSGRSARRVAAETLADLPVAGPGLDLAAELGRAENWDGGVDVEADEKQKEQEQEKEKEEVKVSNAELEALRAEVKTLKDANKALSLYASKIIDRIISQEGFEHVLAVDYENPGATPAKPKPKPVEKKEEPKPRPVSLLARAASLSISSPAPPAVAPGLAPPKAPLRISTDAAPPEVEKAEPATPMGKRERRGLSLDWGKFTLFSRGNNEPQTPAVDPRVAGLKPLNLRADAGKSSVPSSPIIHGGRKLDNEEDEEDRIERERLHAQMKLMGYEKEPTVHTPGAAVGTFAASMSRGSTTSSGADTPASREVDTPGSRMSVGWGRRPASVRQDSTGSGVRFPSDELRAEHLELEDDAQVVAAAETRIAALDRQEKALSAEMAKGRGGGFTEPPGRGTRVRRRSNGSGSGSATSTLFSAGRLSRGGSEADIGEDAEETV